MVHFHPEYSKRQYKVISMGPADFGIMLGRTKLITEREGPYPLKQVRLDLYKFVDKNGDNHSLYFFM
jgi:hypothetical protein